MELTTERKITLYFDENKEICCVGFIFREIEHCTSDLRSFELSNPHFVISKGTSDNLILDSTKSCVEEGIYSKKEITVECIVYEEPVYTYIYLDNTTNGDLTL